MSIGIDDDVWMYQCPECGELGAASADCWMAACPRCGKIIRRYIDTGAHLEKVQAEVPRDQH